MPNESPAYQEVVREVRHGTGGDWSPAGVKRGTATTVLIWASAWLLTRMSVAVAAIHVLPVPHRGLVHGTQAWLQISANYRVNSICHRAVMKHCTGLLKFYLGSASEPCARQTDVPKIACCQRVLVADLCDTYCGLRQLLTASVCICWLYMRKLLVVCSHASVMGGTPRLYAQLTI